MKEIKNLDELIDVFAEIEANRTNKSKESVKEKLIKELPYFLAHLRDRECSKEFGSIKNSNAIAIDTLNGNLTIL